MQLTLILDALLVIYLIGLACSTLAACIAIYKTKGLLVIELQEAYEQGCYGKEALTIVCVVLGLIVFWPYFVGKYTIQKLKGNKND